MSKEKIETAPDYRGVGEKIKQSLATYRKASQAALTLELAEDTKDPSTGAIIPGEETHPEIKQRNEAKRQAQKDAKRELEGMTTQFHQMVRGDLMNDLADVALDRIAKYSSSLEDMADMMVGLSEGLASATRSRSRDVPEATVKPKSRRSGYGDAY